MEQIVQVKENYLREAEGNDAPQCGKGWADRCRNAKGAKCSCKCGGHNHGKNKLRHGKRIYSGHEAKPQMIENEMVEAQDIVRKDMSLEGSISGCWATREVCIWGKPLSPRPSWKLRNHSPDGFAWGYGGSGPAQWHWQYCYIL